MVLSRRNAVSRSRRVLIYHQWPILSGFRTEHQQRLCFPVGQSLSPVPLLFFPSLWFLKMWLGLLSMLNRAAGSSFGGLVWISMLSTSQLVFEVLSLTKLCKSSLSLFGRVGVQTNSSNTVTLLLMSEGGNSKSREDPSHNENQTDTWGC